MKWLLSIILILITFFLAANLRHNLTSPTFTVRQLEDAQGGLRIVIEPNFVVNSIYSIAVVDSNRTLLSQDKPQKGRQVLGIPGEVHSGDVLTVRCDLQYDQWMAPCITTIEKRVVLE